MKFLCLGYFEPARMDALPKSEMDAVMGECVSLMGGFLQSGQVLMDAGLELEARRARRVAGEVQVTAGRVVGGSQAIGSVSVIEARDLDEAMSVALKHPSSLVAAGEKLGWQIEVRPIHSFTWPGSSA
jgi:hypothetical protein